MRFTTEAKSGDSRSAGAAAAAVAPLIDIRTVLVLSGDAATGPLSLLALSLLTAPLPQQTQPKTSN
jgi:hypothetical protein